MIYKSEILITKIKEYKNILLQWLKKHKLILHGLIFLVTFVFEVGDGNLWWDYIFGRSAALQGIEILTNGEGQSLSKTQNPKEFGALVKMIEKHKKNFLNQLYTFDPDNLLRSRMSMVSYYYYTQPTKIYIEPPITISSGSVKEKYVLDYTPVLIEFYIPRKAVDESGNFHTTVSESSDLTPQSVHMGSIADVKNWVNDSRRRDRFVVLTLFVGSLSLLSAL
jgi:hypothetical protein